MNLGTILAAISIVIVAGPLVCAVIIYRDNPFALVIPDITGLTDKIRDYFPKVEYAGYEIIDPESSFRVKFNVTNNYNEDFTFNTINFSAYCSEHEAVLLGSGYGENFPLTVPGGSSTILSLIVTYTAAGQTHIEAQHRGDKNFYVTVKDMLVAVQGVEVELGDEINVGPIEIPP